MGSKPTQWRYGQSPNPRTWGETADMLKQINKPKRKSSLMDRVAELEKLLKERGDK